MGLCEVCLHILHHTLQVARKVDGAAPSRRRCKTLAPLVHFPADQAA